jgi:hypothetical protein
MVTTASPGEAGPGEAGTHKTGAAKTGTAKAETGEAAHDTAVPEPAPLHRLRPVVIVLALAFFFTPAIAAAVGVRATHIENKKLSSFPAANDGWHIFGNFDTWATDHLPLRGQAVKANTNVDRDVFGENPNYGVNGRPTTTDAGGVAGVPGVGVPQQGATAPPSVAAVPTVVTGSDGWLFFGQDFQDACTATLSPTVTAQRLSRLSAIVRAAGKQFVLFIAPDKTDIYSNEVPDSVASKSCAVAGEKAFWSALAANPPVGYQDLHAAILQQKAADPGSLLYRKTDTHWNNHGALIYAKMLANAVDPTLWQTTVVSDQGSKLQNSDLSALLSAPHHEFADTLGVSRPGVVNVTNSPVRIANTTTDAPLITKPTLLVSDSFTDATRFALNPLFANAGIINSEAAGSEPAELNALIKSNDLIVVEIVERVVVGGQSPILTTSYLDSLAATLGVNQ